MMSTPELENNALEKKHRYYNGGHKCLSPHPTPALCDGAVITFSGRYRIWGSAEAAGVKPP